MNNSDYRMHRITHERDVKESLQEIVDAAWQIIRQKLQSISSDNTLEKVVKYYLECLGATEVCILAKTCLSKEQGDADVVDFFEALQIKVIVQVKHYLKEVNEEADEQEMYAD